MVLTRLPLSRASTKTATKPYVNCGHYWGATPGVPQVALLGPTTGVAALKNEKGGLNNRQSGVSAQPYEHARTVASCSACECVVVLLVCSRRIPVLDSTTNSYNPVTQQTSKRQQLLGSLQAAHTASSLSSHIVFCRFQALFSPF